ncbi:hypothetical protein SCG7086_AD_00320 [Chlamydiales bacterium SCGC AG-110-P3]|nr:hypothetical protein SCG7086_AD_00320 [Chlamydiales bacterium SCGC AG-110-P3]
MQTWKHITTTLFAIATLSLTPLSLQSEEYDLGSGDGFYDEGAGFDNAFTTPGIFKLTAGSALALGMIAGGIAILNDGSRNAHSGH